MNTPVNTVPGRYLVFAGRNFFPRGGAKDIQGTAYTELSEAVRIASRYVTATADFDWVQVYDTITQVVVFETKQY